MSTSLSEYESKKFTKDFGDTRCCLLRLTVNPNSKVIPVLPSLSRYPNEYEIILNKEFNFILSNIEKTKSLTYYDIVYTNGIIINTGKEFETVVDILSENIDVKKLYDETIKFKVYETLSKRITDKKLLENMVVQTQQDV